MGSDGGEGPITLDKDIFLRSLIRTLSGTLEDVVGLEEASGYIALVGRSMGSEMNDEYTRALGTRPLNRDQVTDVLVDLKARIGGDFYVIEADDERIVLGNRCCPFGDKVIGRSSMCMMTSNVFGVIAADNLGYGAVELSETIAEGAAGCRVVIHLSPDSVSGRPDIREYFGEGGQPHNHDDRESA